MPTNRKIHEVRKQVGKTDIEMGIHCEAPTPTLFYFCFSPSLPMFLSSFFCIQKDVFFSWNGEDRYCPTGPFSSFPILFQTKSAEMRQNFSTRAQTTQSWQIPTKCTQVAITASHEIQDYIANCLQWDVLSAQVLYWQHWNKLILIFGSRGHLVESPLNETRSKSSILIHFY